MRRAIHIIIGLVVIIGLSLMVTLNSEGGSAAVLNAITPSSSFAVEKDVAYGAHERHRTDFYKSAAPKAGAPMVVFIHGGGWSRGDKKMYKFLAEGLTSEGYDVALPNYRIYPEVIFPDFLDDSAEAIAAVTRKEPGRPLVVIGHSAGAYNALMMAFAPEHLQTAGVDVCTTISGIVSLASPTGAIPAKKEPTITIFPDRFTGDDAPLNHTDQDLPPLLLVNGEADTSVHPANAAKLGEALAGRKLAKVKTYEGADHVDPVRQFSRHFDHEGPIKDDVLKFIDNLPAGVDGNFCR